MRRINCCTVKSKNFRRIVSILFLSMGILGCNAYNLDDKIRTTLQPALVLNSSVLSDFPLSNQGVTRDLSTYTTGGKAPYQYALTITGTVQNYMTISLNGASFFVGRNTAVLMPTALASLPLMPTIEIKVTDAAGGNAAVSGVLQIHVKRVFVTKDMIGFDSTSWNTGGAADYSNCSTGDPVEKANCRCQVSAKARGIPGGNKFKVWLSSTAIDASCNLVGVTGKACVPAQYAGGPWYNMIGNLVAEDIGSGTTRGLLPPNVSTNQPLQSAIQYYDDATTAGILTVWGGTNPSGVEAVGSTCTNWSGVGGTIQYGRVDGINSASVSPFWNGGSQTCTAVATMSFYCFEAD